MNRRALLHFYPRSWRERYGDEFLVMLDERLRLRDVVDVILSAANEWMAVMTGVNRWNDQAQRTTKALAQAAACVIAFQTFVPTLVSLASGHSLFGAPKLWQGLVYGFVSSLLQSAVTLGPVAFLAAVLPWHNAPHRRLLAAVLGAFFSARIAGHIAWGPIELTLVLGGAWVAYRTADTPEDLQASMVI